MKTHRALQVFLSTITLLASLTALLGGLAGCGGTVPTATPTPTRTPRPTAMVLPPSPTPAPHPPPTPPPTPTPIPENVNPLTGEVVADKALLDRVPVLIKITNYPPQYVWPQAGINSADLIFEHYNEGFRYGTRWTAIYLGKDPQRVGPVRSGRLIDLELTAIYKGVLACWGFSDGVRDIMRDSDLYPDRIVSYSLPETLRPDPFYRDFSRDVPLEHTGYTDPGRVRAWAEAHGIKGRQQGLEGMVFSNDPPTEGTPARRLRISWHQLETEWVYDPASGRYLRFSNGLPHTDTLDGKQLSAANVVVLYVSQWLTDIVEEPHSGLLSIRWALWNLDNPYRRAVILRDGVAIEGIWNREKRWDMLTLTDPVGNPIPLKVGNTFFEVVPTAGQWEIPVVIEP
jgi:hypothetical protein